MSSSTAEINSSFDDQNLSNPFLRCVESDPTWLISRHPTVRPYNEDHANYQKNISIFTLTLKNKVLNTQVSH